MHSLHPQSASCFEIQTTSKQLLFRFAPCKLGMPYCSHHPASTTLCYGGWSPTSYTFLQFTTTERVSCSNWQSIVCTQEVLQCMLGCALQTGDNQMCISPTLAPSTMHTYVPHIASNSTTNMCKEREPQISPPGQHSHMHNDPCAHVRCRSQRAAPGAKASALQHDAQQSRVQAIAAVLPHAQARP